MTNATSKVRARERSDHDRELVKEAATMALYVAICLLAALTVASQGELAHRSTVLKIF